LYTNKKLIMNFTEFLDLYKANNTWADKSEDDDLPPMPVQWVKKPKKRRPVNSMPLGTKR
jgi:hypothetical protein